MTELTFEVCIAGGGPSGAVLARRLAALGHEVCLIERAPSASGWPGESLAPGILPVLQAAGMLEAVAALAPLRPDGALVRWGTAMPVAARHHGIPGLLIDRGRFDRALRAEAASAGTRVLCPAIAGRPARLSDGAWYIPVRAGDRSIAIRSRLLCDATGRRGLLGGARTLGIPMVALSAHFPGAALAAHPIVEALPEAWLWAAPLPDGATSAMAFIDPARLRARRGRRDPRVALFRQLLGESSLLARLLDAEHGPVSVRDATPFTRGEPAEPGALRVGEASFAIDPLSSQGVQAAMTSALQAAVVAHTLLVAPERTGAAMRFYGDRRAESVHRHTAWAAQLYAQRGEPFWVRRATAAPPPPLPAPALSRPPLVLSPTCRLSLAKAASLAPQPCLDRELVVLGKVLVHPALDRPVAYLGDTAVAPLLEELTGSECAASILTKWSRRVSPDRARALLEWFVAHGVLELSL